ncbi:flagellar motor switch protein FliN [Actinotalea sp.]|uniref:flagellar motor switch protein FliN n=1 Tax=Actinotalea sp. TaxID=1872145 RepID=UPI00356A2B06
MSPHTTDATLAPETVQLAQSAAAELARLLPSTVPLDVAPATTLPSAEVVAVRAAFVGAVSAELVLVADQAVAEAVAQAGGISLAEALRPALEAAAATLGNGVLDTATSGPVGADLAAPDLAVVALAAQGTSAPQAWFGLRVRTAPGPLPHQRTVAPTADLHRGLRLLQDVEMTLTAEIGRTRLPVRQVLELVPGTVLELDRAAGAPADVMVNGRLVARGEVVVVDEEYGIRITEIVSESL